MRAQFSVSPGLLVHGLDSSSAALSLGAGLFLFPADVLGGYRDLVLEKEGERLKMDVVFLNSGSGIAIGYTKEAASPGPQAPIGELSEGAYFINALTLPAEEMKELPAPKEGMVFWGFDAAGRISSVHRVLDKKWTNFSLADVGRWLEMTTKESPFEEVGGLEDEAWRESLPGFQPEGVAHTLERMLNLMGYDPVLARRSRNAWAVREGSAELHLAYAEEHATLCAEVHLVRISEVTDRKSLLTFLLRENRMLKGYGFSIQGDLVVVALHIPAVFIREEVTSALFLQLLKECDVYDNQLVSVYGAKWI